MRILLILALGAALATAGPAAGFVEHEDDDVRVCIDYGGGEIVIIVPVPLRVVEDDSGDDDEDRHACYRSQP